MALGLGNILSLEIFPLMLHKAKRRLLPNRITDFEMKSSFNVNIQTVETKLVKMAITQDNGSDRKLAEIFVGLK